MHSFLVALAAIALPGQLVAQVEARRPLTREDLETFLDAIIPNELKHGDIAGAIVTVVKDGQVLLSKGYGWSDVAKKIPIFPDSTLFRIASISKTFNATAVMQLVEQGKVDLDANIQTYLDFELPRKFPQPITLRHLLTHTAGFEESGKELPVAAGETSVELGELMKKMPPHQIYPPGTVTSYSNYGADLAGYIVERVSGVPFEEYIRQHITAPLGMLHSSFAEPLPPDLARLMSKEYTLASDDSVKKFEVLQGEPSGNMSSTGMDMARYMITHLQLGRFDSVRILAESTARYMSTTQFRTHPAVQGMAVGFFEESRDGYRMIGHGGDLSRFHSHMTLLLDENVGFFISVNSAGSGGGLFGIRETVIDAFMHRYFPRTTPLEPVLANAQRDRGESGGTVPALPPRRDHAVQGGGALPAPRHRGQRGRQHPDPAPHRREREADALVPDRTDGVPERGWQHAARLRHRQHHRARSRAWASWAGTSCTGWDASTAYGSTTG